MDVILRGPNRISVRMIGPSPPRAMVGALDIIGRGAEAFSRESGKADPPPTVDPSRSTWIADERFRDLIIPWFRRHFNLFGRVLSVSRREAGPSRSLRSPRTGKPIGERAVCFLGRSTPAPGRTRGKPAPSINASMYGRSLATGCRPLPSRSRPATPAGRLFLAFVFRLNKSSLAAVFPKKTGISCFFAKSAYNLYWSIMSAESLAIGMSEISRRSGPGSCIHPWMGLAAGHSAEGDLPRRLVDA